MARAADNIVDSVRAPDLYTGEPPLQSAHNTWKNVKTDLAYALGPNVHRSWTARLHICLLYTSPSPRDRQKARMPSSA